MNPLPDEALEQLFKQAKTPKAWQDKEVEAALLVQLYNLIKLAPTSGNSQPGRFTFLTHVVSKEKLRSTLSAGNVDNVLNAPVVVIIAQDPLFYEELPKLYPQTELRSWYSEDIPFAEETAFRNSSLQSGYLIMAARALGLDVWPMSGFDNSMVDTLFFEEQGWHSNLLVCLGYAKKDDEYERLPRLEFEDACLML